MRCRVLLISWLFCVNAAVAQTKPNENKAPLMLADQAFTLLIPKDEAVNYQGLVNLDNAGLGTGAMMYPGLGLAGFFAALVTHGVIIENSKSSQKSAKQLEADKVLLPYQDLIKSIKYGDLLQAFKSRPEGQRVADIVSSDSKSVNVWLIESTPIYLLTSDERALILQNYIAVYAPGKYDKPVYQNIVKAVSDPMIQENAQETWLADAGKIFKDTSYELFSSSLSLAFKDIGGEYLNLPEIQKTVRYKQGKADVSERAQLLYTACGRVSLRNLRGALMSVPIALTADSETKCEESKQPSHSQNTEQKITTN